MNKNLTEMVFILDRSGSMSGLEADTIGGFNSMIKRQQAQQGDAYVSTVLFNASSYVLHDRVPVRDVREMTLRDYVPSGSTALMDAVGDAIHHIGNVHKYARAEDVPAHTVVVIMTDGMENSSRRYTRQDIKRMIEREQLKYGWEFLFLGANIDALDTADSYGIRRECAVDFNADSEGIELNYQAMHEALNCIRSGGKLSESWKKNIERDFGYRTPKRR